MRKFDSILKENGILIINVMEQANGKKEIYKKEPFNPKYNTYFNTYSKDFFNNWFNNNDYKIIEIIDNPLFNPEVVKEPTDDTNQFSIIARKK